VSEIPRIETTERGKKKMTRTRENDSSMKVRKEAGEEGRRGHQKIILSSCSDNNNECL
jgi:hypothetical protein